jgi:hypothetical protein
MRELSTRTWVVSNNICLLRVFQLPTTTMLGRSFAVLALAGSAAAFSPMMSMEIGRREIVQAGAAAAAAAPLLRANPASAKYDQVTGCEKSARASKRGRECEGARVMDRQDDGQRHGFPPASLRARQLKAS